MLLTIYTGWRGRNERTLLEGIFPRSYVRVLEEKSIPPAPVAQPIDYGNMPLQVSQSASAPAPAGAGAGGKVGHQGKKFGKKLGNAG